MQHNIAKNNNNHAMFCGCRFLRNIMWFNFLLIYWVILNDVFGQTPIPRYEYKA